MEQLPPRDEVMEDDDLLRMVLERADPISVLQAGCTCARLKRIAMDDRVWIDRCRLRWAQLSRDGAWKLYRWLSQQEDERNGLREECSEAQLRHQQAASRAARFSSELALAEQTSDCEMRQMSLAAERAEAKALAVAMADMTQMEAAMDEKAVRLANQVEAEVRSDASRRAAEMAAELARVECKMEAPPPHRTRRSALRPPPHMKGISRSAPKQPRRPARSRASPHHLVCRAPGRWAVARPSAGAAAV